MTKRERVLTALKHKKTDIVPYQISLTSKENDAVAAYFNDKDFMSKVGNHIGVEWYEENQVELGEGSGIFKDEFGVIWDKSGPEADIGVVKGVVLEEPSLKGFKFAEVNEKRWRSILENIVSSETDEIKLPAIGFALYDKAWTFRGMENFLMDMIDEPEFAEELLDLILDYNLKIIDIALEYEIDGFHFADDWGQQKGLVMGPSLWRKFIKPRVAKMYERIKSKGKIVSQHSCGDNYEIFGDLVDIGLDVYQTLQPEIYHLKKVKKEFGQHLSFWGGISTQHLLPFGTPDEVRKSVKETLELMSENGGYIAGPSHDVVEGIPPENVEALIEVLQNQA